MNSNRIKIGLVFLFSFFACSFFSCEETEVVPSQETESATTNKTSCDNVTKVVQLQKRWINTFTEIDEYDSKGRLVNTTTINPTGFFDVKDDFSYHVTSDGTSLRGTWKIDQEKCLLVLDCGTKNERGFQVLVLEDDSLTIQRKEGSLRYTQHYEAEVKPEPCRFVQDCTPLTERWKNAFTIITYFNEDGSISYEEEIRPVGYFKVNPDKTYNVLSDGVAQDGNWKVDSKTCKLILDSRTSLERSFEVLKVTADSLVIFRKESSISYEQHYFK